MNRLNACLLVAVTLVSAVMGRTAGFDQTHPDFNRVLSDFVRDGRVNYRGLKAQPGQLTRYLDAVAAVPKAEFKSWSEADQLAFLTNTYNATTLKLIIDHYPLKSIRDIGSVFKGPWDQPVVKLFGETLTLDHLEHKIMRVDYAEPRLHFALVCAAIGCPPLRGEAFVGSKLNAQLDDQARQFLGNATLNRVDAAARTVYLSPIFKWYADDFIKAHGSVLSATKPYWPAETARKIGDDFTLRYTDYDWSLNATTH